MSQSKTKEADKKLGLRAGDGGWRRWRTGFIIGAVVIALMLAILGGGYYWNYVRPLQRTIITVDDTPILMDYFIKRTKLQGAAPMAMLDTLASEQIIKQEAPRYGITVSPEDITQELRRAARGESETISESEFQAWYREQINESRFSDSEFREIVAVNISMARLHEYFAERMPTVAEHVHLQAIMVEGYENAQQAKTRMDEGEAFADLAKEVSLDEQTKETGGDLGWIARGVLDSRLDNVIFSLDISQVSMPVPAEPQPTAEGRYFLFMVSEKADARELDEISQQIVRGRALETWLAEEKQLHEIKYNFNSEINAWIMWQLSKLETAQE